MSTSLQEALDRLSEVEARRDLLRYRVAGWSAWPILRFELSLLLTGISFPHRAPVGKLERAILALRDLPSLGRVRQARHLIKTYSSGLVEKSGARYRDIWFDDILLAAGSVFKIEVANSRASAERSTLAAIRRDLSGATIDLLSSAIARRPVDNELSVTAHTFAQVLRDDLQLSEIDDQWVIRRLHRFTAAKRVYGSILHRVEPRFVLVADPGEHALVAAAKERRLPVLELQHGIADASNASYAWPAAAKSYRDAMPIPDRLLLYGEHWRRELDRLGFWDDALTVVGSPRLDRYRAGVRRSKGESGTILFTTQGLDVAAVTVFLRDALQQFTFHQPFRLVVKLHPIHDADPTPYREAFATFGDTVQIFSGDEGPSTFECLQQANLHLSVASASHYDAVGLGVPTIVLPFRTHEIVLPMVRANHAFLARTPTELAALLRTWQNLSVPEHVSNYYFQPGALANVLRELALDPPAADRHQ